MKLLASNFTERLTTGNINSELQKVKEGEKESCDLLLKF